MPNRGLPERCRLYKWPMVLDKQRRDRGRCSKSSEGTHGWKRCDQTFGLRREFVGLCRQHLPHFSRAHTSLAVVRDESGYEQLARHPVEPKKCRKFAQTTRGRRLHGDTFAERWSLGGSHLRHPADFSHAQTSMTVFPDRSWRQGRSRRRKYRRVGKDIRPWDSYKGTGSSMLTSMTGKLLEVSEGPR